MYFVISYSLKKKSDDILALAIFLVISCYRFQRRDRRTRGQREGKHIVPSRVKSGRSLKIEATWVAQGVAQLVKYLTLLQDFDWQYLTACSSVFTVYHKPFCPTCSENKNVIFTLLVIKLVLISVPTIYLSYCYNLIATHKILESRPWALRNGSYVNSHRPTTVSIVTK